MTDRIKEKLGEHFIRRMRNWARWRTGGVGGWGPSSCNPVYLMAIDTRYRESVCPVLSGEAQDTEQALLKLPVRYREAVRLHWLYEGNSLRWLGRRLMIDHHTAAARVEHGHALLADIFREQSLHWRMMQELNRLAVCLSPNPRTIRWPGARSLEK